MSLFVRGFPQKWQQQRPKEQSADARPIKKRVMTNVITPRRRKHTGIVLLPRGGDKTLVKMYKSILSVM